MSATLSQRIRQLGPIRGLLASIALSRCAVLLFPFYGAYLAQRVDGISATEIGLIVGSFGVGALIGDLVVGRLTRWLPERSVAVGGLFGVSVAVIAIALAGPLWCLIPLTVVWGACYELVNPISNTMVSRTFEGEEARFGFAALRLAVNAGMGIGPVVAGLLYHFNPEVLPWGTAVGFAVAGLVLARSGESAVAVDRPSTENSTDGSPDRGDNRTGLVAFLIATLPIHIVYALPSTAISIYVISELHYSAIWVSAIFALNAALVITCEIALNHATASVRRRWVLLAGFAFGIVGFGLMGAGVTHAWLLLVATVIWTVGEMVVYPVMTEQVSAVTSSRHRAQGMGYYTATMNIGVITAPMLFLPALTEFGPVSAWLLAAGLLLAGMAGSAYLSAREDLWGPDPLVPADEVDGSEVDTEDDRPSQLASERASG